MGHDAEEGEWQEAWHTLLRLPESYAHEGGIVPRLKNRVCQVVRSQDLAQISVRGRPNLYSLELYHLLVDAISQSSSPAGPGSQRTPDQLSAGVRRTDMAWVAKGVPPSDGGPRPTAASMIGEIKADIEKAKAGFAQGLLHAALNYELSGAQLSFSAFRERFSRLFAISERIIACDRFLNVANGPGSHGLLDANAVV